MACFREFAGAGELANVRIFGIGDDFAFFAVAERADNADVVAECNLVEVVFACELDEFRAALRAAPVAIELATFLETCFYGDVFKVERHLRVFFCHALQKLARSLVCKITLDVDGSKFALRPEFAESCGEFH